ncbi:histidine kinase [uncultured Gammaproteobacteria bacterium]
MAEMDSDTDQVIKSASILIVDDNSANVLLLRDILQHQGYGAVRAETDSRKVIELCQQQRPDLLLLDIRMPHIDGLQLMDLLRVEFGNEFIPVLVLTAQIDQDTRRKALEKGASDFLTKPFVTWELVHRVRNTLHTRMLYRAVANQNRELEQCVAKRTWELTEALAAARKANQAKLDFLSMMSHELRTPLNSIIGFAEVMTSPDGGQGLPAEYAEYLHLIEESGRHLLDMVNKILDFTRGATGTAGLEESTIELPALINFCVALLMPKAMARSVTMLARLDEPVLVRGDERRLRDIVLSLLDNAIKFNRVGGKVEVDLAVGSEGVVIAIADDGPGIAANIQEQLFAPFIQGEGTLDRHHEGIGLGLPIVRRFAEMHGGKAELSSFSGRGTVVRVLLPKERLVRNH